MIFTFLKNHSVPSLKLLIAVSLISIVYSLDAGYAATPGLKELAGQSYAQGNYKKAVLYYTQALLEAKNTNNGKEELEILFCLAYVCDKRGDHANTLNYFDMAVTKARQLKDTDYTVKINLALADLFFRNGNYNIALIYYNETIKFYDRKKNPKETRDLILKIGECYRNNGEYEKAINYYNEELSMSNQAGDKGGMAEANRLLGKVLAQLSALDDSLFYLGKAANLAAETKDHDALSRIILDTADVYKDQGYSYTEIVDYLKAMQVRYKISVFYGPVELEAGDYYLEAGKFDEAENIFARHNDLARLGKVELYRGHNDDAFNYFFKAINANSEKHDPNSLFAAYYGLGLTYLKVNDSWQAWKSFEKAMKYAEEVRDSLSIFERERFFKDTVYGFNKAGPYDSIISSLFKFNYYDLAFKYCEYQRARGYSEPLMSKYASFSTSIPQQLRDDEININDRIREQRRVLNRISIKDEENVYKAALENFNSLNEGRKSILAKIRKEAPQYASLFYPEYVNYEKVDLWQDEALIEFKVCADITYVFLLRRGKLEMKEIKISKNELKALINEYMDSFNKVNAYEDLLGYRAKQSKKLYSLLFSKITKGLPEDTFLIIVPDDILGILPFDSLIYAGGDEVGDPKFCTFDKGEGKCGPYPLGVKYFCDIFNIEYAPSAYMHDFYRSVKRQVSESTSALAVCDAILSADDPRFDGYKANQKSDLARQKNKAMTKWVEANMVELKKRDKGQDGVMASNLKKTCTFAYVAEKVFGKDDTTIYSDLDANEKKIMSTDYSRYKYVFFDTYCFPNNTLPWIGEPAIILNPGVDSPANDGFLTVSNIMSMKIPSDTVLMSINLIGADKTLNWQGVSSMASAFQFAGAGNTVISLWPVKEEVTIQLLNAYLSQIKEGIDPYRALRRAKNSIRKAGWEHPYYWASYIMY